MNCSSLQVMFTNYFVTLTVSHRMIQCFIPSSSLCVVVFHTEVIVKVTLGCIYAQQYRDMYSCAQMCTVVERCIELFRDVFISVKICTVYCIVEMCTVVKICVPQCRDVYSSIEMCTIVQGCKEQSSLEMCLVVQRSVKKW